MIETKLDGRVLNVTLNRPARRNALTMEMCEQLLAAFDRANDDPGIGAVFLQGHGPSFCSGMDLEEALTADENQLSSLHERLFTASTWLRKPMVAWVHGAVVAGGTGLAAQAHVVYASTDATFGLTEIRVGLWPFLIYRAIAAAIGERRATEWSLSGRIVPAEEAKQSGLVTTICQYPLQYADERAKLLAGYSANVIAKGLEYTERIRTMTWEEAGKLAWTMRNEMLAHPDFTEGVQAFKQKRAPVWTK